MIEHHLPWQPDAQTESNQDLSQIDTLIPIDVIELLFLLLLSDVFFRVMHDFANDVLVTSPHTQCYALKLQ